MVRNLIVFFIICMTVHAAAAQSENGTLKGRTAYKGEVAAGVEILLFREKDKIDLATPDGIGGATGIDGSYEFSVPAGRYYLVALKKKVKRDGYIPGDGDLYCFYSGAPVEITAGGISYVGFNMVVVRSKGRTRSARNESGVYGRVLFDGKPLARSYVYAYRDFKGGFRGPAFMVQPSPDGAYRMSLPPGSYYLIARKRNKGGMYGPIEEGDYFNFYPRNPIVVPAGSVVNADIETVKRLSQLEEGTGFSEIRGTVRERGGRGVGGLFVLVYQSKTQQGKPLYISSRTGTSGEFSIKIPQGTYYLVARESIGGPSVTGEWFGRADNEVVLHEKSKIADVVITVEKGK